VSILEDNRVQYIAYYVARFIANIYIVTYHVYTIHDILLWAASYPPGLIGELHIYFFTVLGTHLSWQRPVVFADAITWQIL